MDSLTNLFPFLFQPEIRILCSALLAILLNLYSIPVIIKVARRINFFDVPNSRTSHNHSVPTMGGLGIYFSITLVSLILLSSYGLGDHLISSNITSISPIIAGFTLIFFVGMKDDILNISPWKKLIAEILALLILIVIGNVRISNLQGMFGIGELNDFLSLMLSLFVGIVVINSINLVDGVDGLASSIIMIGSTVLGIYFYKIQEFEFAILAFTTLGSLIPFFIYNTFGKTKKIFMGDTGSLLLGFIMTVLIFRFNKTNSSHLSEPYFVAGPAFCVAVIVVPLFDTLRVFAIRIMRGGSPFKADRRHIHHLLLDLNFTHVQTTLILSGINLLYILFAYYFNYLGNLRLMIIMLISSAILSGIAIKILRGRNKIIQGQPSEKVVHNSKSEVLNKIWRSY